MKTRKVWTTLTARCVPLLINDIDTDTILPADYLTSIERTGYGWAAFRRLRERDAAFVFDQPRYQDARILIAGANFGCGSSREHAVWALLEAGLEAIIAPSFADIFASNSAKNGLLLVTLAREIVESLALRAEMEQLSLTIDLEQQTVRLPSGDCHRFSFDPFRKHCLLHGVDDLDYLRGYEAEIKAFRNQQEETRFCSTLPEGKSP